MKTSKKQDQNFDVDIESMDCIDRAKFMYTHILGLDALPEIFHELDVSKMLNPTHVSTNIFDLDTSVSRLENMKKRFVLGCISANVPVVIDPSKPTEVCFYPSEMYVGPISKISSQISDHHYGFMEPAFGEKLPAGIHNMTWMIRKIPPEKIKIELISESHMVPRSFPWKLISPHKKIQRNRIRTTLNLAMNMSIDAPRCMIYRYSPMYRSDEQFVELNRKTQNINTLFIVGGFEHYAYNLKDGYMYSEMLYPTILSVMGFNQPDTKMSMTPRSTVRTK